LGIALLEFDNLELAVDRLTEKCVLREGFSAVKKIKDVISTRDA